MEQRRVSIKEIKADMRAGMADSEILEKHQISEGTLQKVFSKLLEVGALSQSELDNRMPFPKKTLNSPWKCPACGKPQTKEVEVCPDCGVIINKFREKQSESQSQETSTVNKLQEKFAPIKEKVKENIAPISSRAKEEISSLKGRGWSFTYLNIILTVIAILMTIQVVSRVWTTKRNFWSAASLYHKRRSSVHSRGNQISCCSKWSGALCRRTMLVKNMGREVGKC